MYDSLFVKKKTDTEKPDTSTKEKKKAFLKKEKEKKEAETDKNSALPTPAITIDFRNMMGRIEQVGPDFGEQSLISIIRKEDKIKFFNTGGSYIADEVGCLRMDLEPHNDVKTGDVGYVITGVKNAKEIKVGDTITLLDNPFKEGIHGFEDVQPMLFAVI